MTQPHDAATPLDEQCPPLKVLEFAKRTVLIYPPPDQLWAELNELDSIVGHSECWPFISRQSGVDTGVCLHATWSHHVLETVIGHCARISMSGPLDETLRIFVAILGSWDTNHAWIARRKGFVRVLVLEWARSWDRTMKLISLALDPHPEVAGGMQAWGEESARRALATKGRPPEVVPAAAVNIVRITEETRDAPPTCVVPLTPESPTSSTPQKDPPATPPNRLYADLWVACETLRLIGKQRGLVVAIVDAGKPVPIADLLLTLEIEGTVDSGWGNTVNPLNAKLEKHGLRIRRANSQAILCKFSGS